MSNFDDLINISQGTTSRGGVSNSPPIVLRRSSYPGSSAVINPAIDEKWGGIAPGRGSNSYYDYYFSGQDIKVFIDGAEGSAGFDSLPITELNFRIEQNKQVIYGFWSNTYDAVMRGNRVVSGSFALTTLYPNYMKQAIALAARSRANHNGSLNYNYYRNLTEDDTNIQQYWGNNMDPSLMLGQETNLFSTHPPFSFVILYGIQNVSLVEGASASLPTEENYFTTFKGDNALTVDVNERLVSTNSSESMRIVLDACELTSMSSGFDTSGNAIVETYEFFCRDIVIPNS